MIVFHAHRFFSYELRHQISFPSLFFSDQPQTTSKKLLYLKSFNIFNFLLYIIGCLVDNSEILLVTIHQ